MTPQWARSAAAVPALEVGGKLLRCLRHAHTHPCPRRVAADPGGPCCLFRPGSAAASAAPARPDIFASEWCGNQAPPCVEAASRNGVAITEADPTYAVSASGSLQGGEFLTQWSIADALIKGTYATLAPGDVGVPFSISIDVGRHDPRVVDEYAGGVSVTKAFNPRGGNWNVTIAGTGVEQGVNADCNAVTFTCPFNDTNTIVAFQGEVGDWQQWPNSAQWNDFSGLNQWTNVEETAIPPQISGSPLTISEQLGNSHELNGTVFDGFWYATLPNAMLVDMGINDPSTLTSAGISASVGTGSVAITPGATSTEIAITGITFSPRTVHIRRGVITPNAPTVPDHQAGVGGGGGAGVPGGAAAGFLRSLLPGDVRGAQAHHPVRDRPPFGAEDDRADPRGQLHLPGPGAGGGRVRALVGEEEAGRLTRRANRR